VDSKIETSNKYIDCTIWCTEFVSLSGQKKVKEKVLLWTR